jgi:hypothetical protein
MTKLYPIGTKLYTSDLETAAGYVKRFGEVDIETFELGKWRNVFHADDQYLKWRVTVTPKNQYLLSPVPIVGDVIVCDADDIMPDLPVTIFVVQEVSHEKPNNPTYSATCARDYVYCDCARLSEVHRILERNYGTYNSNRLPFLEGLKPNDEGKS